MKILLLGATGLVGTELRKLLQEDLRVRALTCLVRRPFPQGSAPAKERMEVVDFNRLTDYKDLFAVDAVICALGTTIKTAGSQAAFASVDLELVRAAGLLARSQGVSRFLVVSAHGARDTSPIFYNRTKGEMERALAAMGFPYLTIAQPSLLLGDRKEYRRGERWLQSLVSPVLRWIPAAWRPIYAYQVAKSLMGDLERSNKGIKYLENRFMVRQYPFSQAPNL